MPATVPWSDEDDARLRELHAAETSVRAMADELGRSKTSVARRLKHHGLSNATRTQTHAATAARLADARARRATLRSDLLGDAERLRAQLWKPTVVFNFGGKENTYEEHTLPEPPFADKQRITTSVSTLIGTIERLDKMDADAGLQQAVGMLDAIAQAIKAVAGTLPAEADG